MKKQLLIWTVISLFSGTLFSQEKDSIVTLPTVTVTSATRVSAELNKAFRKEFPDAQNLQWYKLTKNYLAKFIQDDMQHNSLFAKNGKLQYDISFGYENNLPEAIRTQVQSAYTEYKITRAVRVTQSGREIWVVNLEGLKNYLVVRHEDGELQEVQRLNKS